MAGLIAIVGETASGKSALAMELAERFNGEIICADSRTVYKGMDIGTAKPSEAEQVRIRHYGLDIVRPDQAFTVADFKQLADAAIRDIASRGKVPILVGGTGLYIDAVIFDYQFSPKAAERDPHNPRHLLKTEVSKRRHELPAQTLLLGLIVDRKELEERIKTRVQTMLDSGLEAEVKSLVSNYGWGAKGLSSVGYIEFKNYFAGDQTLAETKQLITKSTLNLAKKQRTWFKRNPDIHWVTGAISALALAENWPMDISKTGKNTTGKIAP